MEINIFICNNANRFIFILLHYQPLMVIILSIKIHTYPKDSLWYEQRVKQAFYK